MPLTLRSKNPPTASARSVMDLRPHPRYQELCGPVSDLTLFEMSKRGESLFETPLAVTNEGIILDGYKRWLVAKNERRADLLCTVYYFDSDAELLTCLVDIQVHKPAAPNDFFRIMLTLELEPMLRDQAKERQRIGGKEKGSSNLAKDSPLDVRAEVARIAGVSAGNVTKVKQLREKGCPQLLEALKSGEISIHLAHSWSNRSLGKQIRLIREWRGRRDAKSDIRKLLSKHIKKESSRESTAVDIANLILDDTHLAEEIPVEVIRSQTPRIFVTEGAMASLRSTQSNGQSDPKH